MAKKPEARKPNNMAKRELNFTRALLRSNNVLLVNIRNQVAVFNSRSMNEIAVGSLVQRGINDVPHHWTVTIVAVCETEDGQRYFKPLELSMPNQHTANQLTEVLLGHAQELEDTCSVKHFIRTVWLATPYPKSWDETEIDDILERESAWSKS